MADKKRRRREFETFPCVIYALTEENEEHQHGYRYRVHDIDDDMFYFADKDRMKKVLQDHAMMPVKPDEMEELRAKRAQAKPKK